MIFQKSRLHSIATIFFIVNCILGSSLNALADQSPRQGPAVLPQPAIELYGHIDRVLSSGNGSVAVGFSASVIHPSQPVEEGLSLFARRLLQISGGEVKTIRGEQHPQVLVNLCTPEELLHLIRDEKVTKTIDDKNLTQAYFLQVGKGSGKAPMVTIKASHPLGIYYGFVSLCQLTVTDGQGKIKVREGKILDWPETKLRLAKASATRNSHEKLTEFADWLAIFKMNVIGLQFHGENSKEPGKFIKNLAAYTSVSQGKGLVESIVYFSPFRGEQFDFRKAEDKAAYLQLLHQIMDLGVNGIEVDYNDWGNVTEVPIEDVLNLVAGEMEKRVPTPVILFCPPQRGDFMYRGPASDEAARVLSLVPENIWPLWVGAPRFKSINPDAPPHRKFFNWTLTPELTEAWTDKTGRKPFLWINRVAVDTENSFSIELEELPGAFVFNGLRLPVEMGRLFEGVHFNCDVRLMSNQTELIYFATAADFLWNPYRWHPAESYRRALHFAEVMGPLME